MKRSAYSDPRERSSEVMETHWKQEMSHKRWGYTCPNPERYEWQWLWDSCFHAIIWAELGDADRGLLELETLLAAMEPSGFLPHMNYVADPAAAEEFWGREGTSTITQPPMFGHAIAELVRRGVEVPEELAAKSAKALRFFLDHRIHETSGLTVLCHPWESGADDSLRWDSFYPVPYVHPRWQDEKIKMLATIQRDSNGAPLSNPLFPVASAWFTALVAFNITELASTTDAIAATEADGLVEAVENSWDEESRTWADVVMSKPLLKNSMPIRKSDAGDARGSREVPREDQAGFKLVRSQEQHEDDSRLDADSSPKAPVLEALLGVLADRKEDRLAKVCEDLFNPQIYGAPFGPAGASQSHKAHDGYGYWRGAAWPQLTYLLAHALQARADNSDLNANNSCHTAKAPEKRLDYANIAQALTAQLRAGAIASDFAEHWHPQTAHPGGATPQSWAALAAVT